MTAAEPGVSVITASRRSDRGDSAGPRGLVPAVYRGIGCKNRQCQSDRHGPGVEYALLSGLAGDDRWHPVWLAMIGGTALFPGALLTTLATPFFLLVPAATRRWPPGGRIYFATVCLVNTTFCSWLPGGASGTSLFLLPGVTLAGLIFHRAEGPALLTFLILPLLAAVLLDASQPYSPFGCGGDACVGLWRMNMASVAVLFVFFGFLASRDDP